MNPIFSERPGLRERHWRRRYENPLFAPQTQQTDAADLMQARQADEDALKRFQEDLQTLLKQAAQLPAQADSEAVLELQRRIDRLYAEAASLPGDRARDKAALNRLHDAISAALLHAVSDQPDASRELEEAKAARTLHIKLLEYPLVADLLHPESPITPEELAPTLMCEGENALRAALTLFDAAQREDLRKQARRMLVQLKAEGLDLSECRAALAVLDEAPS